ncbi:MAG: hypothetical protein ACMZ66_12175 [Thalassospira sp.]|uniref:hypothetical protein n=1 Tax=Thalassospira sp. TaxID=1912094 RepID=UPI003A8A13D6
MAPSDNATKPNTGPSYMAGPKPGAPIPRYEPGTDTGLRDRLRTSSASTAVAPITDGEDGFTVPGVEGMIDRKKANVAAKIVDTDPDQALRVIRNWLLQD